MYSSLCVPSLFMCAFVFLVSVAHPLVGDKGLCSGVAAPFEWCYNTTLWVDIFLHIHWCFAPNHWWCFYNALVSLTYYVCVTNFFLGVCSSTSKLVKTLYQIENPVV